MRAAGLDLPTLVDNDKRAAPENYFGVPPDKNIDYRRVPNLAVYFRATPQRSPRIRAPLSSGRAATSSIFDDDHIGIVSDRRNASGVPYLIHHAHPMQRHYEENTLASYSNITGHYRVGTWQ